MKDEKTEELLFLSELTISGEGGWVFASREHCSTGQVSLREAGNHGPCLSPREIQWKGFLQSRISTEQAHSAVFWP